MRKRIDARRSLVQLVQILRKHESTFGPLIGLEIEDDATIASFDGDSGDEPRGTLRLTLGEPPEGAETVCSGTVYVLGEAQRVTAYRARASARKPATSPRRAGRNPGSGMGIGGKSFSGDGMERPDGKSGLGGGAGGAMPKKVVRDVGSEGPERGQPRRSGGSPKMSKPPTAELPELEPREYRVWFGTDRKPNDPADISKGFSGDRGRTTRYGHCDVFVPESHKIGSIGSSALRRLLSWSDDRLKVREIAALESEAFWSAVASQVGELEAGKRHAVVFIHGYNVSFEEAAIRAAQIGFDLGVGAMGFFSWPSKGELGAYKTDSDTIEASEPAIADFLADFATRSGAEAVHVIVHSMGNKGVARAMKEILADAERRGGCRFGQIMLAAADVDSELFGRLAGAYQALSARTTLYVSKRDLALKGSKWLADYPRVGFYPPVSVFDGIDTVSVSNIDLSLLGHGYVGEARDVLQDMHRLIFEGTAPPRFGLKERRNEEGKAYWEVGA